MGSEQHTCCLAYVLYGICRCNPAHGMVHAEFLHEHLLRKNDGTGSADDGKQAGQLLFH